jgi:hypothetical protein
MATGFPASTGDVLSAAMFNGLTTFTIGADKTANYTFVLNDQYQALIVVNSATAKDVLIPTDASVAFPIGTAITVYNEGAGLVSIKAVTSGTTTIQSRGAAPTIPTLASFGTAVCIKLSANLWAVVGAIA